MFACKFIGITIVRDLRAQGITHCLAAAGWLAGWHPQVHIDDERLSLTHLRSKWINSQVIYLPRHVRPLRFVAAAAAASYNGRASQLNHKS